MKDRQLAAARSGSRFQPGCTGKRTYSKGGAKAAIKGVMTSRGGAPLHAYHCESCGRWHLSHDRTGRNGASI